MADEIEGKNGGTLRPFQPGQSGNPSGISSEMKRMHMRAAELSARLRLAELEAQATALEATGALPGVTTENLRLWKEAEDRALGAPHQTQETSIDARVTGVDWNVVYPAPKP